MTTEPNELEIALGLDPVKRRPTQRRLPGNHDRPAGVPCIRPDCNGKVIRRHEYGKFFGVCLMCGH